MSYRDWGYYKPKPLKPVRGGIRAQSKRGNFGQSWWAKRWISVLESFDIGARLSRGRSYARGGQVMSIDIDGGEVRARVQGSSEKPYKITIRIKTIPPAGWEKLAQELSTQAVFAARLLSGEMPQDIEQAFKAAGLSLFPEKLRDMDTSCSCPDWSNPCKHIAAVYYLLGEEFDRDPFLLFKLRGMEREEFISMLGAAGPAVDETDQAQEATEAPEPLSAETGTFWQGVALPPEFFGEVHTPPVEAALLKRLGNFPFWRGSEGLSDSLTPIYAQASARGLAVFAGLGEEESD